MPIDLQYDGIPKELLRTRRGISTEESAKLTLQINDIEPPLNIIVEDFAVATGDRLVVDAEVRLVAASDNQLAGV